MAERLSPGQVYQDSLYRAKSVSWCCLSCGMPFTLPMDAYSIDDPAVQRFNKVVQDLHQRMRDEQRCGTDQWDPVDCVPLDASIGASVLPTLEADAGWKNAEHKKKLTNKKDMVPSPSRPFLLSPPPTIS